jgi:hypothetical protein
MPDLLAKIYIGLLIGSGLLGLSLHAFHVFRPSPESSLSRKYMLRRKRLFRKCAYLIIGVTALALFSAGVLGGLGVLVVGWIILISVEYALALLIKPRGGVGE